MGEEEEMKERIREQCKKEEVNEMGNKGCKEEEKKEEEKKVDGILTLVAR